MWKRIAAAWPGRARGTASLIAVLACGAAAAAPTAASTAPGFHDRIDDTFVDPNFCDSGVAVQVHDVVVGNGQETDIRLTVGFNEKATFTYGDRSIVVHSAGRQVHELVEGDSFEGPHTELVFDIGLRAQLRVPGGGLVQSDAGNLQYLFTFDDSGLVDFQILSQRTAGGMDDSADPTLQLVGPALVHLVCARAPVTLR